MPDGIDVTRDIRTPAEVSEKRTAGVGLDYRLVVLQANAVGAGASLLIGALMGVVFAFGGEVFWIVASVVGVTTLIYWLRRETAIERELYAGEIAEGDANAVNLWSGIVVTLFCGFVAWCTWRVLSYINPRTWYAEGGALDWRLVGTRVAALVFLELVVFAFFRFVFLFVAFGQEMIQRSPMQEQFIWQAAGEVLKAWGLSRVRQPRRPHPPIMRVNGKEVGGNGRGEPIEQEPTWEEFTPEQEEGLELMQFLVLGQMLTTGDDQPILYSRRQWNGIRLPSGRVMGVSRARAWAESLTEWGILQVRPTASGEALNIARDLSLDGALKAIAQSYDVPLPTLEERERWARGGQVPT